MKLRTSLVLFFCAWALGGLVTPSGLHAQPTFSLSITPPQATICSGGPGLFLNVSVASGTPALPLSYQWLPAAGLSNDSLANPFANPTSTTTYTVIVTDSLGDTASASVLIAVETPATISPPGNQCLGVPVSFSLQNSFPDSLVWNFGGGAIPAISFDTLPSPVTYGTPGPKMVTLTAFSQACGTYQDSVFLLVHEVQAAFQADSFGCVGSSLVFSDLSFASDTLISWDWSFGDGVNASIPNPTHVYSQAQVYPVTLTVTSNTGCDDTATLDFEVFDIPIALFTDTLIDCQVAVFTNQSIPAAYFWDFGDGSTSIQPSPTYTYLDTGLFQPILIVSNLCGTDSGTTGLYIGENCVWPGDANNDLLANNVDILSLGLLFGTNGPARPNANLDWAGQSAPAWGDTLPGSGGLQAAFGDTDGNGLIDLADTLAIALNYGLTHNKTQLTSQTGTFLYFDTTGLSLPVPAGSQVTLPIMLGTPAEPADSSYGLAFTIQYEPELIDSASANFAAPVSWLGSNLLSFSRDFYGDGALPAAITRTDQLMVPGEGQIAQFTFVMIDDIARQSGIDTLDLDFGEITLIDARGRPVQVQSLPARIPVSEHTNGLAPNLASYGLSAFPNPVHDVLHIDGQPGHRVAVGLYDLQGHALRLDQGLAPFSLSVQGLPAGSYLLRVQGPRGPAFQLIQKRD